MKILFLLASRFDGDALAAGPLGGTETALIGVSRELARLPQTEVFVCANTSRPRTYDRVHYLPMAHLAEWSRSNSVDIFMVIRSWLPLWLPVRARCRVYLSPDAFDQPGMQSAFDATLRIGGHPTSVSVLPPREIYPCVDSFFCVGQWQAQTFIDELGIPRERVYVTGNAIFPDNFQPMPLALRTHSIMYSATPFRGLEYLLDYYHELKASFAELRLEVCSGMGVYGHSKDSDDASYGPLYRSLETVGAKSHGSIRQQELSAIMCRSRVYTYPNTFAETFCISVLEAQAAGLPVVTTDLGALPERIDHGVDGFLIKGHPAEADYRRAFLEVTSRLLTDDDLWQRVSEAARRRAQGQNYQRLAASWREKFAISLAQSAACCVPTIPPLSAVDIPIPGEPGKSVQLPGEQVMQFIPQAFGAYGFG